MTATIVRVAGGRHGQAPLSAAADRHPRELPAAGLHRKHCRGDAIAAYAGEA